MSRKASEKTAFCWNEPAAYLRTGHFSVHRYSRRLRTRLGRACVLPFASFEIALRSLLMPLFCADRGIMRRRASSGAFASCLHRPSAYLLVVAFWPCDLVSGADFRAPCRPGFEIIIASASAPGHFCTVRPSFRHTAAQRSRNRWYPKHPHSIAIHSDVWAMAVTVAVPVAMKPRQVAMKPPLGKHALAQAAWRWGSPSGRCTGRLRVPQPGGTNPQSERALCLLAMDDRRGYLS